MATDGLADGRSPRPAILVRAYAADDQQRGEFTRCYSREILRLSLYGTMRVEAFPELVERSANRWFTRAEGNAVRATFSPGKCHWRVIDPLCGNRTTISPG